MGIKMRIRKISKYILAVCLLFWVPLVTVQAKEEETISQGVYIESVDLSGLTEQEAHEAITAYLEELSTVEVTLKTIEDKEVIKTMGDLGVQATNEKIGRAHV